MQPIMEIEMLTKKILFFPIVLLLSSCATPYAFAPDERYASVKLVLGDTISMCKDGKMYKLDTEMGKDVVRVPVGSRISIGTYMSYSGYNVTYTCNPFLSFSPVEGQHYITDSNVITDNCYIDIVKIDDSTKTGLAVDDTVGRRDCFISQ